MVLLSLGLLPTFLLSRSHTPNLPMRLTHIIADFGLFPWERAMLKLSLDPYHQQFIAIALILAIGIGVAVGYQLIYMQDAIKQTYRKYRYVSTNVKIPHADFDGETKPALLFYILGTTFFYAGRLASIFLLGRALVGQDPGSARSALSHFLAPEFFVFFTELTALGATLAICKMVVSSTRDVEPENSQT